MKLNKAANKASGFITATEAAGRIALECGVLTRLTINVGGQGFTFLETANSDAEPVGTAFRDGTNYKIKLEHVQLFIDNHESAAL